MLSEGTQECFNTRKHTCWMTYGRRLEQALHAAAKTTADLAAHLTISPQAVNQVIRGTTKAFNAENHTRAAIYLHCDPLWLASGEYTLHETEALVAIEKTKDLAEISDAELAGTPRGAKRIPVIGTAKLGSDGYYEELASSPGHGDGFIDSYSHDPDAYALRVKGDSMHPAIRHGSLVIVEPNGRCVPGEYVAIALKDGTKMVKELVIERPDEMVVESVNGQLRRTIEKIDIERVHPVGAIVPASKWRPI